MPWAISVLQRGKDLNCSSGSAWSSPRRVASVWQFLTRAPRFLYPTHFCLGFSAMLKLWEEEQPRRDDSRPCWRPGDDSEVELAHRPTAALYHRAGVVDSGSGGAGEAPAPSSLATPAKDAVTSSWHLLAHSLPKNVPNIHLLPSDLIFPEHEWPGLVTGLQARAQPLPLCDSTKAYCKCLAWHIQQLYLPCFMSVLHWGLIIVLWLINAPWWPHMTPAQGISVGLGRTSCGGFV